jgi:hypothetical protein
MAMPEQHTAILAELAELGLSSARDLHARQLAAETPEQASRLAFALHRISRSIRQTLALQAKLERDARRTDLEDLVIAQDAAKARKALRRDQVKATVERLIWIEHEKEGEDADHLVECLGELLAEDLLHDDFDAEPVEVHIAKMCEALGLPYPRAGEGVGRGPTDEGAPGGPDDDDPLFSDDYWRSSA